LVALHAQVSGSDEEVYVWLDTFIPDMTESSNIGINYKGAVVGRESMITNGHGCANQEWGRAERGVYGH